MNRRRDTDRYWISEWEKAKQTGNSVIMTFVICYLLFHFVVPAAVFLVLAILCGGGCWGAMNA